MKMEETRRLRAEARAKGVSSGLWRRVNPLVCPKER